MFETGARLKQQYGDENVFDYSLGNPSIPPPQEFSDALKEEVSKSGGTSHIYMPNSGYPHIRRIVAEYLREEQDADITENEVIMTCGAGGALNVIMKTVLNEGEEVLVPSPFFGEYKY